MVIKNNTDEEFRITIGTTLVKKSEAEEYLFEAVIEDVTQRFEEVFDNENKCLIKRRNCYYCW